MSREAPTLRSNLGLVVAGCLLAFFVGVAAAVAVPAFERGMYRVDSTTPARSADALQGKSVYFAEGCQYCHTQGVRPVSVDLGLGKVAAPARSSRDYPTVAGMVRVGPDLSCVGDRYESAEAIAAFVSSPKQARPGTTMPSYRFLDEEEMMALAQYLHSLTCGGKRG